MFTVLLEVFKVFSPEHESGQRSAEQNVDIPAPGFRSPRARRTGEQNVDIPVPRSRAHSGLQGFFSRTEFHTAYYDAERGLPVPSPRPSRGFHPIQGSQRTVEQVIDIPVFRTRHGEGLLGVHF